METKKKAKKLTFKVVCYVVAAILVIAAIFMLIANLQYIIDYMAAYEMTFMDMWGDILQYIISGFVPYFAYAFLVFSMGRICRILGKSKGEEEVEEVFQEEPPSSLESVE